MTAEEIKFFDKLAESWDKDEVLSTPARVTGLIESTNIMPGMSVLDLGTGTGVLIPAIATAVGSQGHIVAIDISQGMLNKAKHKFGHLPSVEFMLLDFEHEAVNGLFDRIFLYCVYPHLHHPAETLKRLVGNLKTSGKIIIAFPTDEKFINDIHRERGADSEILPSASELASRLRREGLNAVAASVGNPYIIIIEKA